MSRCVPCPLCLHACALVDILRVSNGAIYFASGNSTLVSSWCGCVISLHASERVKCSCHFLALALSHPPPSFPRCLPTRFENNLNDQVATKWLCFRSSSISSRLRPLLLALPMTRSRQEAQQLAHLACPALRVWEASVMPRREGREEE